MAPFWSILLLTEHPFLGRATGHLPRCHHGRRGGLAPSWSFLLFTDKLFSVGQLGISFGLRISVWSFCLVGRWGRPCQCRDCLFFIAFPFFGGTCGASGEQGFVMGMKEKTVFIVLVVKT